MKHLRYIHIQGSHATSYCLKGPEKTQFENYAEQLTGLPVTFISSPFRSDCFYQSERDLSVLLIEKWCLCKGKHFSKDHLAKFSLRHRLEPILEHYFYKLMLFTQHATGFSAYSSVFSDVVQEQPQSKVIRTIRACSLSIVRKMNGERELAKRLEKLCGDLKSNNPGGTGAISLDALSGFNPN